MRAVLLVVLLAAGCLQAVPTDDAVLDEEPDAATGDGMGDARVFPLSGAQCLQAGGHSVHPRFLNPLPEPWLPADVIADVGPQLVYSEVPDPMRPVPEEGNTIGNYHATMMCDKWQWRGHDKPGLLFGFVGMKVETPPFSEPGPSHEYLVTVVATSGQDVAAALQDEGIQAMHAGGAIDIEMEDTYLVNMETDHNGVYDSIFKRKDLGDMDAPWVRLWFQHANDDGTFSPIALDMHTKGGAHFGAEGQGFFSHTETQHHEPLPGIAGHTAALGYDGFWRGFTWGPRPNVTLPDAYVH